jgi:exonuclease VII small subunit
MSESVFLLALAMAGTTLVLVAGAIAGAIRGRGGARSDLARLVDKLEQHDAALDETQGMLASQAAQLAELQERLDFAERMLAQGRDHTALKPGGQ